MTARPPHDFSWDRLPPILGRSSAIQQAVTRLQQFARTRVPVLLVGPTGTGKELLARHLHAMSERTGELVDINCGALPREMIESILFGHRRGAFTGAIQDSVGLVARAGDGTLFLDELPSLPVEGQAKLLRLLETGEIRPIGDSAKRLVDFRLVSAVQDDIAWRVDTGLFRRDLFHRVAGVAIHLPPLSQRLEDVELLATHFAAVRTRRLGHGVVRRLEELPWPGNVRELGAVIDRAAVLSQTSIIELSDLVEALSCWQGGTRPPVATHPDHKAHAIITRREGWAARLAELCSQHDWDPRRIGPALGVSRATLYRRLRECGIRLHRLKVSR